MKALAAILLLSAIQGRTLYEDPTRSIRVHGYTQAEGGTLENGDFEFSMSGRPAVVESRLEGMTISGPTMGGVVAPATNSSRSFVRQLEVEGGATVTLDSEMAYQAQVEMAKRLGAQTPVAPTARDVAILKSDRFSYTGLANGGTLTIPQPFAIESKSSGKEKDKSFEQTLIANGSQATINLDPASAAAFPIKSGTIAGPVTVKMVRTESATESQTPTRSELEGVADKVEIDMEASRTITMRGNVKVSGFSGLYQGASEGDVVVVTLDETLKPIRIRITGDPTKSTLRERKPGGGLR